MPKFDYAKVYADSAVLPWQVLAERYAVSRHFEDECMSTEQFGSKQKQSRIAAQKFVPNGINARNTVVIRENDTLVGISEQNYHSPIFASLLADINIGKIRSDVIDAKRIVRIKTGQEIRLPTRAETELFLARINPRALPVVITIVERCDADAGALNTHLKTLVSPPVSIG
jgi:hypothetical protein